MTTLPVSNATRSFSSDIAGTLLKPTGEIPINSMIVDMVLAVNCPPHAPAHVVDSLPPTPCPRSWNLSVSHRLDSTAFQRCLRRRTASRLKQEGWSWKCCAPIYTHLKFTHVKPLKMRSLP